MKQRSWAFTFPFSSVTSIKLPLGDINTKTLPVLWSSGQSSFQSLKTVIQRDAGADFGKAKPTKARGVGTQKY